MSRAILGLLVILVAAPAWAALPGQTYVLQNSATGNGNGQAPYVASFNNAEIQTTAHGAPTFTLNFESSGNGTDWAVMYCRVGSGGTWITMSTTAGSWRCMLNGASYLRVRISGFGGAGAVNVIAQLDSSAWLEQGEMSAQSHITGTVQQLGQWVVAANQQNAWSVSAHQASEWRVAHISSVVHVSAATAGGLIVNCVAGCSGAPAGTTVVSHVTSVTHVAGSLKLAGQDGTTVTLTGTSINVNCTGGCGSAAEGQTYVANVFASAAGASKDHLSLFNASGSGRVLKVRKIKVAPEFAAALTGLAQSFRVSRTSSAGSTCTGLTVVLVDTANAAVPAQVTASTNCTTDPTVAADLLTCAISGDETASMDPEGICYQFFANGGQPITLREGQGLMVKSSALSGAYPVSVAVEFTM